MPFSIFNATASTTTIASSTTMPIASTSPSSVSVLMEKPIASITPKVPMIDTGMVIIGISVVRMLCRNTKMITSTRTAASQKVWTTSAIDALTKRVVS